MEEIKGKGALVLLHFKSVLVFGKILCHGDKFIADIVPAVQHLIGTRTRRTQRLVLRLNVKTHSEASKESDRN